MDQHWPAVASFVYELHWADLDANDHVNNLVFMRLFQECRIRYSHSLKKIAGPEIVFVLASVSVSYHRQVFYPGELRCRLRVDLIGRTSYEATFETFNNGSTEPVCSGKCVMVITSRATGKAVALASVAGLLEEVQRLEHPRKIPCKPAV